MLLILIRCFSSDKFFSCFYGLSVAHIKNKSAIPWGVGIHPLNPKVTTHVLTIYFILMQKPTISQLDIPRCQKCFGYLNMYCLFDSKTWQCPLCHFRNKFDKTHLNNRYATSIERSRCEECLFPNITMEIPLSKSMYVRFQLFNVLEGVIIFQIMHEKFQLLLLIAQEHNLF